jgi:hypothetical protein
MLDSEPPPQTGNWDRFLEAKHKFFPPASAQAASVEWLALDKRFAEPTVAKLGLLQGMYTKYGQTAAGLSNTLSPVWVQVPCLCL